MRLSSTSKCVVRQGAWVGVLAVLVLLLPGSAEAASTNVREARSVARTWLSMSALPLRANMHQRIRRTETITGKDGTPLFHVIHLAPDGFVLVAGDDDLQPIIAFAARGAYVASDKNPLHILAMRDLKTRMAAARQLRVRLRLPQQPGKDGVAGKDALTPKMRSRLRRVRDKWRILRDAAVEDGGVPPADVGLVSDERVPPIVGSRWSQGSAGTDYLYNYYTPGHYACGCVATAMAQLMRFHEYPVSGVGTPSFTIYVDGMATTRALRGGNGAGGPYAWGSMPLVPGGACTVSERQAIGALCHDAGVAVNMMYTCNSSGSYMYKAAPALLNTFQYSNAITGGDSYQAIPESQFVAMINPNLDAGYPVMLGIYGALGHAIVCDGYGYHDATLYHHLNLGWGGLYDAWYDLPTVVAGGYYFYTVGNCVYNVYPSGTGEIISGRVVDNNGSALHEATVTATRSGGGTYVTMTNARGIYALAKIPSSSTYTITVTKPGYSFASQTASTSASTSGAFSTGNLWAVNFTGNGAPPPPTVVLVDADATGANNGASWADAYTSLAAALQASQSGQEIWVAEGVYKPTTGTNRATFFTLKSGVSVYGGFAGNETARGQRDPKAHPTVLSGDIGAAGSKTDNCYHVVVGADSAILDGVTIRDGNANGYGLTRRGGGMLNNGTSPTVRGCVFTGNEAEYGAGMANLDGASPSLIDCVFHANAAINMSGACDIQAGSGGAVGNLSYSPTTCTNCVFSNNSAQRNGGALYSREGSHLTITSCTFSGNSAWQGKAAYIYDSTLTARNSIFWDAVTYWYTEFYKKSSVCELPDASFAYCTINYRCNPTDDDGGNIDSNPQFADPLDPDGPDDVFGTADDGLRLLAGSPSIDCGLNSAVPAGVTTDITGAARIQNNTVDRGAYEGGAPFLVSVSVFDAIATEGEGNDYGRFAITRPGGGSMLNVQYQLSGTAQNGTDYLQLSGTAVLPAGNTTVLVHVIPVDDALVEGVETVTLTLLPGAGYAIGSSTSATLVIQDNDKPEVTVTATDPDACESGPDSGTVMLTRTGPVSSALTVRLAVEGTALNGSDFEEVDETITIPLGASSVAIPIVPIDDDEIEGEEVAEIQLEGSPDYVIGPAYSATVRITDNDPSSIEIRASDPEAAEEGTDPGIFTFSRTGATDRPLTIRFSVGGTATRGRDFTVVTQPKPLSHEAIDLEPGIPDPVIVVHGEALQERFCLIAIPAGQNEVAVTVVPVDDRNIEGDETIDLTLLPGKYALGAAQTATVTIADNDRYKRPTRALTSVATKIGKEEKTKSATEPEAIGVRQTAAANRVGRID